DIQNGLPTFEKVGQASQVTRKTWEGVRSAMKNSGFAFLNHKIIVNLTPADIKKGGRQFDLAIAMGIAIASG
ncbi:MAG: magnesium chelatase domain-containing protein, partial [Syntrophomonas sp.]